VMKTSRFISSGTTDLPLVTDPDHRHGCLAWLHNLRSVIDEKRKAVDLPT
jgi:hypothetical protein